MSAFQQFRNSGVGGLNEIPSHWNIRSLKRMTTIQTGITLGKDYDGDLIERPYLRVANVQDGRLDLEDVTTIEVPAEVAKRVELQAADVLMTEGGDLDKLGRGFLWNGEIEGCLHQNHIFALRCLRHKLNPTFLTYLTASRYGRNYFEATGKRTTNLASTNSTKVGLLPVPLPPIDEQRRIVSYLDASCTAIDAAVCVKRRQLETLDALRRTITSKAVTHGIDTQPKLRIVQRDWLKDVAEHWQVCRVKRVLARMDYGISVSTIEEGRFPVLKMGHIQDGEISFSNLDFVDDVRDELLLETGDLLYNRTNSPDQVGKAAVFRKTRADAVTFASYLVRLRINHRANPYFLNYVFNSDGFLGFARRLAIPSVQQSNLNSTRYAQMHIPLPPLREQELICIYLDAKLGEVRRIADGIESQMAALTAYRKSLIHECVTGQRRVTEGNLNQVEAHG
jgi:type I restriction enzyme, S subunit